MKKKRPSIDQEMHREGPDAGVKRLNYVNEDSGLLI